MSLFNQLRNLDQNNDSIRIGLIGAGKFGTMFASQAIRLPGIHVVGIADINIRSCKSNLELAGWKPEIYGADSLEHALLSGTTYISEDHNNIINEPRIDIIIECTGNPIAAVDHIISAFDSGKHVISATVEADALCGVSLARKATEAGVIYSMAYGDQPAMVCELVDWARVCGFEVVAAGRGHKWSPEYRYSTPDTIWDYWGLSREQAERGRLNPKMFNSFLDGTKPAIESSAISNATGLRAPPNGLNYPSGTIDQIPMLMRPTSDGGILNGSGFVEVINSLDSDGNILDYDIRKGVWVNLKAANDYQKNCFEEYKVQTDESGKYFTSYKRWHLIGLELGLSVANVGIRKEPTGVATDFLSDVVTIAKKDLKIGEILDGEGGYTVSGDIRPSIISVRQRALPLGLTAGAKMLKEVKANSIIRYDDISVEHQSNAYNLRKILEKEI